MIQPSEMLPAEIESADLDGWDEDDYLRAHSAIAGSFTQQRMVAGYLLWRVRQVLDDGAYGEHVARVAAVYEVADRTVRRWRLTVEQERGLPPADDRSANSRERTGQKRPRNTDGEKPTTEAIDTTSRERTTADKLADVAMLNEAELDAVPLPQVRAAYAVLERRITAEEAQTRKPIVPGASSQTLARREVAPNFKKGR